MIVPGDVSLISVNIVNVGQSMKPHQALNNELN